MSEILPIRQALLLAKAWYGGAFALFDREYAGKFRDYGNIADFEFDPGVSSFDFDTSRALGINVTEGKPITKLNNAVNLKINAPDLSVLDAFMFGGGLASFNQALAAGATQDIEIEELDVWYKLDGFQLDNSIFSVGATQMDVGTDYLIDTEMGMVMPLSGGRINANDTLHGVFDRTLIDGLTEIRPMSSPCLPIMRGSRFSKR